MSIEIILYTEYKLWTIFYSIICCIVVTYKEMLISKDNLNNSGYELTKTLI